MDGQTAGLFWQRAVSGVQTPGFIYRIYIKDIWFRFDMFCDSNDEKKAVAGKKCEGYLI